MKKNIEWLKDEILTDMLYLEGNREIRQLDIKYQTLREVVQKINSLDEPETLSQEWIDENSTNLLMSSPMIKWVETSKLQNLLVPKQEELEVKIQELIEAYKQEDGAYSNPENAWIGGFIEDLKNLLEEEQKYLVEDKNYTLLCKWKSEDGWKVISTHESEQDDLPMEVLDFELTEQEIKDYDERYWPFAVKVEEIDNA